MSRFCHGRLAPDRRLIILHQFRGNANSEIKDARDLKKASEACGLIIAGFISLDLSRLEAQTCSQVLLRQSGNNAGLDLDFRQRVQ